MADFNKFNRTAMACLTSRPFSHPTRWQGHLRRMGRHESNAGRSSRRIVQAVVSEVLETVFRDGVTDLNTLQPEQFDMLCERMAVEGRMIEHGKEFLLAYAAEMHGQVSRGDAPF